MEPLSERVTSRKFQLAGLAIVLAAIAQYLEAVPPVYALIAVVVIVIVYMLVNVWEKTTVPKSDDEA